METKRLELPPKAIVALELGNKIEAIKITRVSKGLDLKDSKDLVEAYLQSNSALEEQFRAKQSENNQSGKFWFLLIIVVGIAAYFILKGKLF